jgi:hypothetical protein
MTALHAGTLLLAAVCLLGAAVAAVALPGRGFTPPVAPEATLAPAETG